jgi:hypothetical protein
MKIHTCDLMESWLMDERVPIERRKDSAEFLLAVNTDTVLPMAYCPFCGKSLNGSGKSNSRTACVCKHVRELAARPNSAVRYLPHQREFVIAGTEDLTVCLFFCPICGRKLPLHQEDRCRKSPSEVARLRKLFANIKSIEQAVKQVGPPDFEGGPAHDHFYWKKKRLDVGYRKFLLYQRLAKTADVHVVEWSDGRMDVKFFAKVSGRQNVPKNGR